MQFDVAGISNAFEKRHGIPRPNWPVISDEVERQASEQNLGDSWKNDAWTAVARHWLDKMRQSLSVEYEVLESPKFYLLSADGDSTNGVVLQWCEHYRRSILALLDEVGSDEGYGKHIVMAFHDRDTFYRYICDFYPEEGSFGCTGGVFLDAGYGHIALWTQGKFDIERTIAHELTHAMLRHLPLPLWLNEGLTQFISDVAVGSTEFFMTAELAQRHRAYWNADTIHEFWLGASFSFPDEGQELSYSLANVLFRSLNADFPQWIRDFVRGADASDAGNRAIIETCGVDLADRVGRFLGPGPWQSGSNYVELE